VDLPLPLRQHVLGRDVAGTEYAVIQAQPSF
jgi:hypothetical protein